MIDINPCEKIYNTIEIEGLKQVETKCKLVIDQFRTIFPYPIATPEEVENNPCACFDELREMLLLYPSYIPTLYSILSHYDYNEKAEIKDTIKYLGNLKDPNKNSKLIHRLLYLPTIQDISYHGEGNFSIFSKQCGQTDFQLAEYFFQDDDKVMAYMYTNRLANRCFQHAEFLARTYQENYLQVALCKGIFKESFYHAYSLTKEKEKVIDLTLRSVFPTDDFYHLEEPQPIYTNQSQGFMRDAIITDNQARINPEFYEAFKVALYQQYLSSIGYNGSLLKAPKVKQMVR